MATNKQGSNLIRRPQQPAFAMLRCALLLQAVLAIAAAATPRPSHPLLGDNAPGKDWPAFGRTYGEQHYSPLKQISAANVRSLGLVWTLDLGPGNSMTGPIAVDGTLYIASAYSVVRAIDAVTGKLRWLYDPKAPEVSGAKLRQGWGSRGIAYWNGKVYTGTQDGRLIAIDIRTGKPVWSVMTIRADDYRFISGAPRVFAGKVIIGHGGADAADTRGYVTAYDAESGAELWRFYTVPGQPGVDTDETTRMASNSWSGEWWHYGGGGTVWNAITYDEALDQIYLGTGNGTPWNHRIRSAGKGDNLFLSSIVALDAKTGRYRWHYQTNPAETWDYNAAMDMQLAHLKINGKQRDVLMTAPKNGFFYVLDRHTGALISAKPYVNVTWASSIDLASGRPIETPGARYEDKPFFVAPSTFGAHSWLPMAYSARTHLVYIPALDLGVMFDQNGVQPAHWRRAPANILDTGVNAVFDFDKPVDSALIAWDPRTQTARWRVTTSGFMAGGVMATAGGLVFQGQVDGNFNAYADATGELLWHIDAQSPVMAPPITYSVGGQQYITVLTGLGTAGAFNGPFLERYGLDPRKQARRVLTFALGGKTPLPPTQRGRVDIAADPDYRADKETEARGFLVYAPRCGICHGANGIAVGVAPDLRASVLVRQADAFNGVVHDGALVPAGMPIFAELSDAQLADLRQYLRARGVESRMPAR